MAGIDTDRTGVDGNDALPRTVLTPSSARHTRIALRPVRSDPGASVKAAAEKGRFVQLGLMTFLVYLKVGGGFFELR